MSTAESHSVGTISSPRKVHVSPWPEIVAGRWLKNAKERTLHRLGANGKSPVPVCLPRYLMYEYSDPQPLKAYIHFKLVE